MIHATPENFNEIFVKVIGQVLLLTHLAHWGFVADRTDTVMPPFAREMPGSRLTRPDTRQSSRGQLGRSSCEKTAWNSKMLRTDRRTD